MARHMFLGVTLLTMFVSIQSAMKELPPTPPTIQQLPPIPPYLTLPPIPKALSLPPIPPIPILPKTTSPPPVPVGPLPPIPPIPSIPPQKTFPPPVPVGTLPPIPPIPTLPRRGLKNMNCGADKMDYKVEGGGESFPNSWIWQGAIYDQGKFICGGALITSNLFLTAKKCVAYNGEPGSIIVRLGDHQRDSRDGGEQELRVAKIVRHDTSDIAVLKLEEDAELNDKVGIVCLHEQGEDDNSIYMKECYTTGWGVVTTTRSSNNFLSEARTKPVAMEQCIKNANKNKKAELSSSDAVLCGKFHDSNEPACYGDIGGPFVCKSRRLGKWVLQGLRDGRVNECSATDHYTVFTEVKRYISWIEQTARTI